MRSRGARLAREGKPMQSADGAIVPEGWWGTLGQAAAVDGGSARSQCSPEAVMPKHRLLTDVL